MGGSVGQLTGGVGESSVIERDGAAVGVEAAFAGLLAEIIGAEGVRVDSHFFDDLGADSLLMARFCARVRKRGDLPAVSIRDIYRHPTVASLAAAVADGAIATVEPSLPAPVEPVPAAARASTFEYVLCGVLQGLVFLGYAYVVALVAVLGYDWISAGSGAVGIYLRAVLFGVAWFVLACALPVVAKWVLIGRWKPVQIRVWSLAYVRFWVVKTLVRANPVAFVFAGSPLYALYLRALGARVGRGAVIFTRHVPVCTDLLTVGAGAVVRKESFLLCYRAHAGQIQTGAVSIGRDAYVGEKSVLDIDSSIGDGAQLGHASTLHSGQTVPDGERWHGSPAQRTEVNYLRVAPARCGTWRRVGFCVVGLLGMFLLYVPLVEGGLYLVLAGAPSLGRVLDPGVGTAIGVRQLVIDALALSVVVFFGGMLVGLVVVFTVPRVLNLFVRPDRTYPLYGFHDRAHRAIERMTSVRFFGYLVGNSSFVVHYLRCLGWDLSRVEQTGSNFGDEVMQVSPFLSSVGTGTMVADGLSMMNAEVSSSSFRVSRASIGPRNFVGNNITYPAGGKTGENCLLATKVMIPLDGEVREGVGLLGSPCFEIPRSVDRDSRFDHLRSGEELRRNLAAKNRYNIRTVGLFLLARWLDVFLITALVLAAVDLYSALGHLVMGALFALSFVISAFYFALVERCIIGFRSLQSRYCSIYDPYFWRHERLWKVPAMDYLHMFDGTPFKNVIWRLLGVRLGRRVFDDGVYLTERSLAAIGDDCTLNVGSKVQCHSQEDGTFKSDRSTLGAGCTLGVAAHVHYGVTIGDGSVLAPNSFLMKGEEVPPHARWGGNPATEM